MVLLSVKAGEEAAGSRAVNSLVSGEGCLDMVCGQTQTVAQATYWVGLSTLMMFNRQ